MRVCLNAGNPPTRIHELGKHPHHDHLWHYREETGSVSGFRDRIVPPEHDGSWIGIGSDAWRTPAIRNRAD